MNQLAKLELAVTIQIKDIVYTFSTFLAWREDKNSNKSLRQNEGCGLSYAHLEIRKQIFQGFYLHRLAWLFNTLYSVCACCYSLRQDRGGYAILTVLTGCNGEV